MLETLEEGEAGPRRREAGARGVRTATGRPLHGDRAGGRSGPDLVEERGPAVGIRHEVAPFGAESQVRQLERHQDLLVRGGLVARRVHISEVQSERAGLVPEGCGRVARAVAEAGLGLHGDDGEPLVRVLQHAAAGQRAQAVVVLPGQRQVQPAAHVLEVGGRGEEANGPGDPGCPGRVVRLPANDSPGSRVRWRGILRVPGGEAGHGKGNDNGGALCGGALLEGNDLVLPAGLQRGLGDEPPDPGDWGRLPAARDVVARGCPEGERRGRGPHDSDLHVDRHCRAAVPREDVGGPAGRPAWHGGRIGRGDHRQSEDGAGQRGVHQ